MSTKFKSIGLIVLYIAPCAIVYLLSKYRVFELYILFDSLSVKIPALTNYSVCTPNPEPIKSLQLFNVFYSFIIPAVLYKKAIVKNTNLGIKPLLITLPLVAFGFLIMLNGFQLPLADGTGGFIATYYCESEFFSVLVLSLISAGASSFYLMFFIFLDLYIKSKANKSKHSEL
jgi:hypothetical protein